MFLRRLLSALIVSALAAPAIADNIVVLPAATRLLVVDGKDASDMKRARELTLEDGRHQVVFQLRGLVRDGADSDMFTSSPYIMTFDLNGDQTFTIKAPPLRNRKDAKKLTRSPEALITLTSQDGSNIPVEFSVLERRGMLVGRDIVEDIQKFNLSDDRAAVRSMAGTVFVAANDSSQVLPLPAASVEADAESQAMSEKMLQYWYNQADEAARARFLRWVEQSQLAEK